MLVPVEMKRIERDEALRYLGWRGKCEDERVLSQLDEAEHLALSEAAPTVVMRRFALDKPLALHGTDYAPKGSDVNALLSGCGEAVLLAATLGMRSERLLLRTQAKSASLALVLDAVLTAMIEQVCDEACRIYEDKLKENGLMLTQRFSPGYGDMPMEQTAQICTLLDTARQIGLSVSSNGLMIPRKSVTAIMGVTKRTPPQGITGCGSCRMKATCNLKKSDAQECAAMEG